MDYPLALISWIVDMVLPYRCVGCQAYLERAYLCQKCFHALPVRRQMECIGCRRPTAGGQTCPFCTDNYTISQLMVVSDYNNPILAAAIQAFKYRFLPELAGPLVDLTRTYLKELSAQKNISVVAGNPLLVPVPLHRRRENWRGFNQSRLIAVELAKNYQLELSDALVRVGQRAPQADIENRQERFSNVKNIFVCPDASVVRGRQILVIDDVCTTGATLNECALALKAAGAHSISALVIARG